MKFDYRANPINHSSCPNNQTNVLSQTQENHSWLKQVMLFYWFAGLFFYSTLSFSNKYFICGPHEDGCYDGIYQYCVCIPYNDKEANKPYCLNFDDLTCKPLSQSPQCEPELVFKNQGSCLATMFQSEPEPPCSLTTRSFCLKHNTSICDQDGRLASCHPAEN